MLQVPVFNPAGQKVETLEVDETLFGSEVNVALLKQAIVAYHANKRQGTAANIVRIYRQGYIEGGPTGKVARTDPDFRWRIALFWVALVVWLFLCVRAILMLS